MTRLTIEYRAVMYPARKMSPANGRMRTARINDHTVVIHCHPFRLWTLHKGRSVDLALIIYVHLPNNFTLKSLNSRNNLLHTLLL